MNNLENLEQKIDELISSMGGLERLRELSRLSSLDHLVNLHLLSHLTKLDKIEGLEKLDQLDKLDQLKSLDKLDALAKLDQIQKLELLSKLDSLKDLDLIKDLSHLDNLKELNKLEQLDKLDQLSDLHRLDSLGSLRDLKNLERLDHLKYLENLDLLKELTSLTQLDALNGLKELLENNSDKFMMLKHLEALDNLPLLDQLSKLEKLTKLDELKNLDKLTELKQLDRLVNLNDSPPPLIPQVVVSNPVEKESGWVKFGIQFLLDLLRTSIIAAAFVFALLVPEGRKVANRAAALLGFGEGQQVSWALETLAKSSSHEFPSYWSDFEKRLNVEADLIFNPKAPWSLEKRHEVLVSMLSYEFEGEGISLNKRVRENLSEKLASSDKSWMDRINNEIGQIMLKQGEAQRLSLLNQLKDMALGSRWEDLYKLSRTHSEDKYANQAALLSLVHLKLANAEIPEEGVSE